MARARNIKPGFFTNEELVELPFSTRLLFIGLWTLADREGRLEDRPKRIRAQVFPYDEGLDINAMMESLEKAGFLVRYTAEGGSFAQIINFTKHQNPHHKEVPSEIPPPPGMAAVTRHAYAVSTELRNEVFLRDGWKCLKCCATSDLSIDHILPLAKGGDNSKDNLQTLCTKCNASKGDATKDYRQSIVGSSMNQRQSIDGASYPTDSLIPDSLNLESGIPQPSTPAPAEPPPRRARTRAADWAEDFDAIWAAYPRKPGMSRSNTEKAFAARLTEGAKTADMLAGVQAYAAYVLAMGTEPQFIKSPETFFGPGKHWQSDWAPPARASPTQDHPTQLTKAGQATALNIESWLEKKRQEQGHA